MKRIPILLAMLCVSSRPALGDDALPPPPLPPPAAEPMTAPTPTAGADARIADEDDRGGDEVAPVAADPRAPGDQAAPVPPPPLPPPPLTAAELAAPVPPPPPPSAAEQITPSAQPVPPPPPPPAAEQVPPPPPPPVVDGPPPDEVAGEAPLPPPAPRERDRAPVDPEDAAPGDRPHREFVKGELTRVGSTKLITRNDRIGIRAGYEFIDLTHYAMLAPEVDLRFGELQMGFGVPLRLEIFGPEGFGASGTLRKEDYDEPSDFAKVVRYVTYGRKEYRLFFSVSQLDAATLGHGAVMRRYFANADVDATRVGLSFDHYGSLAGFEFHLNDVVAPAVLAADPTTNLGLVSGLLLFVKPLSLAGDSLFARTLSIGATWAGEINGPRSLVAPDAIGRIVTDDTGNPLYEGALLDLAGVDVEFKVLKTSSMDVKPYFDVSVLRRPFLDGEGAWGATAGVLGRFNFTAGEGPDAFVHALRAVAEVRTFAGNFVPGWFDTFYEVEKFAFQQTPDGRWLTKWEAVTGRDPDARHFGTYLELSWSPMELFAIGSALELSSAPDGNNFYVHLEMPALDWLQFFVTYHKRGFDRIADVVDFERDDSFLFAAGRLRLLPILYLNARVYQAFQFDDDPTVRRFRNVFGAQVDVEVGLEF